MKTFFLPNLNFKTNEKKFLNSNFIYFKYCTINVIALMGILFIRIDGRYKKIEEKYAKVSLCSHWVDFVFSITCVSVIYTKHKLY
jgi:hypothetical protein